MHSAGVIHRGKADSSFALSPKSASAADLKPRNLLVNSNCDLKICDYGCSPRRDAGSAGGSMEQRIKCN